MSADEVDALRAELRTAYAELAAVREREETYRNAWRVAARERTRYRLAAMTYRAAARRRYGVMLRLADALRRERRVTRRVLVLAALPPRESYTRLHDGTPWLR
ncbi:hypothetical protein [Nocardiopsis alba]|uniref:hypothetical protein n=1 Tax=Nocardiopsis alba TaxID=53437 RepID=UPI003D7481F6